MLADLAAKEPGAIVRELLERASAEEARAGRLRISIFTLEDDDYPTLLREIADPPPVLYLRGSLEPDDEVRIAIVGSRRASRYGLSVAEGLARDLAGRGVTVVSGLARGIDGAAHKGALEADARTIAVLGSGLARLYPSEHRSLADRIAANGAVVSEYPLDLGPLPLFFPRRNRIVSGLCAGTIVVEAARASGALGTGRLALEQGRELFAVPGSILSETSVGTNALLREGVAHLVTLPEDVLDELPAVFRVRLGLTASPLDVSQIGNDDGSASDPLATATAAEVGGKPASQRSAVQHSRAVRPAIALSMSSTTTLFASSAPSPERGPKGYPHKRVERRREEQQQDVPAFETAPTPDEAAVLRHLSHENEVSFDELAALCGLPVPQLLASLAALELRGLAVMLPGNRVVPGRPPSFDKPGHSPYR